MGWDGLNASDRWMGPPRVDRSLGKPLWYLTSPSVRPSACLPSNSANKSPGMLPMMFTSMFRRSEEHTSELQSLMRTSYAVFCLKKTTQEQPTKNDTHIR